MASRSNEDEDDATVPPHAPLMQEAAADDDYDYESSSEANSPQQPPDSSLKTAARRLYFSHFLSTWNSRVFEFGAVLYLANVFPGTLLPMSVYAVARALSAIVFAPAVGQFIDKQDRLRVVRMSIVVQRAVVATSCGIFYLLTTDISLGYYGRIGMLAVLSLLACLEKLYSIMNMVSVEKDWVVVVAQTNTDALTTMNAQMRRIDLLCKLLGPLFIALIAGVSTKTAILVNLVMNCTSVPLEYFAIARVYHDVRDLQQPKGLSRSALAESDTSSASEGCFSHNWRHVKSFVASSAADFKLHLNHRAFLPSIANALLYLTVLSFSGQMITYLLSIGYDSTQIGIARTFSVAFEVLSTWVAPRLMSRIGPVRAGLWLSSWQSTTLAVGAVFFWLFIDQPLISAGALVGSTILSRVGLGGFDLCTQLIVQEEVEASNRGAFSSTEAAWQNVFELLSYTSTIVFFRPDQFKWPALISVLAVTSASSSYALFVRLRRGHLVHLDKIARLCGVQKGQQAEQDLMLERLTSSSDV